MIRYIVEQQVTNPVVPQDWAKVETVTPVHIAIMEGDTAGLKALLQAGVSLTSWYPSGLTPIQLAAYEHDHESLQIMIDVCGRQKIRSYLHAEFEMTGFSALHSMASVGVSHRKIKFGANWIERGITTSQILLDLGLGPYEPGHQGLTPMSLAAVSDSVDLLYLFHTRAPPTRTCLQRNIVASLYGAVREDNLDALHAILKLEPDIRFPNFFDLSFVVVYMFESPHSLEFIKAFVERKFIDPSTEYLFGDTARAEINSQTGRVIPSTLLSVAARTKSPFAARTVPYLIECGADPNWHHSTTLLHQAFVSGNTAVIRELIAGGADIHAPSQPLVSDGSTILHDCARSERLVSLSALKTIVEMSRECGSEVNLDIKNTSEMTPLHLAVFYVNRRTVEQLLSYGADVRTRGPRGRTPLFLAYPLFLS